MPLDWAREALQPKACLQGNLDPEVLVAGGDPLRAACEDILAQLGTGPFVFNLGHGILPHTPPDHVGEVLEIIRGHRAQDGAQG